MRTFCRAREPLRNALGRPGWEGRPRGRDLYVHVRPIHFTARQKLMQRGYAATREKK